MNTSKTHSFTRSIGTSRKRVSTIANARDTLQGAGFGRDTEIDIITGGQFSLIDLIQAVIEQTGPAHLDLATWTAAEFDLTQITQQLTTGDITGLRLIVDRSFVSRAPSFVKAVALRFGEQNIRTTRTHAKFAVIHNNDWDVVVRTSMNLNHNARTEWAQVAADPELAGFYRGYVDQVFETTEPGLGNRREAPDLSSLDEIRPNLQPTTGTLTGVGQKIV